MGEKIFTRTYSLLDTIIYIGKLKKKETCRFHLVTHPSGRQHTLLSVEATRSTLHSCMHREITSACTALHLLPCRGRSHEASRPEHDDAWGARLSTRITNQLKKKKKKKLASPTALLAAAAGRIMSVDPGRCQRRLVLGSPMSMLPKSKQCAAAQSSWGRPQWGKKSGRSQSQKAGRGRSKSRALASCVRPEWRR